MQNRKDQIIMNEVVGKCFTKRFLHSLPLIENHDYTGRLKPETDRLVRRDLSN